MAKKTSAPKKAESVVAVSRAPVKVKAVPVELDALPVLGGNPEAIVGDKIEGRIYSLEELEGKFELVSE